MKYLKLTVPILLLIVLAVALLIHPGFLFEKNMTDFSNKPDDIIFVMVDALRYDRLGFNGYTRNTSPFIDSLTSESVLFDNFYSSSPWTMPSIATYFTGMYPEYHGVNSYDDMINTDDTLLGEIMKKAGYRTLGLSANPLIRPNLGYTRGFDHWYNSYHDDCLLRILEAYLNPSIPTPEETTENNLMDIGRFKSDTRFKDHRSGENPGYYTDYRMELSTDKTEHEIVYSDGRISSGEYFFGISFLGEGGGARAKLVVSAKGNIILSEDISIGREWKYFSFKIKIDKSAELTVKLEIISGDNLPDKICVDTPFLSETIKTWNNLFVYLHLMEVHEPDKIKPYLEWKYLGKFSDNLLSPGNVKNPPGDKFGFSESKRITPLFNEDEDGINWHNNRYDEGILFLDDEMKKLFGILSVQKRDKDTMFILTSDHGQEFFDHGWLGHGFTLYEELIHVPLLIHYPPKYKAGRIVEKTRTIDFYPTLAGIAGEESTVTGELKNQLMGTTFESLMEGNLGSQERIIISSEILNGLRSAISVNWKLIEKDSACRQGELLFNLELDPSETINLITDKSASEQASVLRNYLMKYKGIRDSFLKHRKKSTQTDSKETAETVMQLGYIAGPEMMDRTHDMDCRVDSLKLIIAYLRFYLMKVL
ncbi:MAG: sulfatase-like hydrolase/transferase [Acidobacteria bacterium]|nr:sulfatase-like hydrolase/transferase [Acidobacteriota bacterium]